MTSGGWEKGQGARPACRQWRRWSCRTSWIAPLSEACGTGPRHCSSSPHSFHSSSWLGCLPSGTWRSRHRCRACAQHSGNSLHAESGECGKKKDLRQIGPTRVRNCSDLEATGQKLGHLTVDIRTLHQWLWQNPEGRIQILLSGPNSCLFKDFILFF